MQKSKKRKKGKIFYGTFSLAVFLFPVIKRAEKVSGFFSVRGEGKCEINYKKRAFSLFLVVSFPEKMIRNCFGGNEKKKRAKKKQFL